ncbi:Tn3 family transposase [Paraburkholderia sabiae]|uniref:Tn3 family transposase n=1 Tax=Paraburkholderia sabiae TaxID=273251 RepID=A0ABU9QR46_9BURK|nr:transposase [Paraburkholderia sabiae]WJZ79376.1 Tn3 family transposase [Paraburkholderia sabiae]CAD6563197.1 hypothetical protein LMG24235_08439 [Paraburkholderia sabiae]
MHTLLNRGESVHQLQRAIYTGKIAPERGRRRDEMIAISGCLTLLTNLVIAWNTQRIQATLDRWRSKGQGVDDADGAGALSTCQFPRDVELSDRPLSRDAARRSAMATRGRIVKRFCKAVNPGQRDSSPKQ